MHQLPIESHDSHCRLPDTQISSRSGKTQTLVQTITDNIAERIGRHCYDMWFNGAQLKVENDHVTVSTDNPFISRWIESNFSSDLRVAAANALGREASDGKLSVSFVVTDEASDRAEAPNRPGADAATRNGKAAQHDPDPSAARPAPRHTQRGSAMRLRRLDEFAVSETNRVAHGATRQIAESRDGAHHSPLFVHGPCGVGKTHLLQGATRHYIDVWRSSHGAARYVTAEQFTNEYISAVRNGRIDEFRLRMRRLELLAIDDVHFLSNKERTQAEFLHTFDEISMSGARVIIASDCHPRQLRRINKALVNRMLSGMVVQIELPDLDLRRRLARKLAADRGLRITDQAIEAVANECTGSIRELEGALNKLLALSVSLQQHKEVNGQSSSAPRPLGANEPIGLLLVQQLFSDSMNLSNAPVRISTIIEVVCERMNVARNELIGSGRHKRVVLARSLISYLCKKMTTHSFPEIAAAIGRRNHSTVHNAHRRLAEQLEANAAVDLVPGETAVSLAELVNQLRQQIVRRHRA